MENLEQEQLLRIGAAARLINVNPDTLRRAAAEGRIPAVRMHGGHQERKYRVRDLYEFVGLNTINQPNTSERVEAHYVRVSGTGQKTSLEQQIIQLEKTRSGTLYKVYKDIGSGINDHRKGLTNLLRDAQEGKYNVIRIVYPDRLTRFGLAYLEQYFSSLGIVLEILDDTKYKSDHEELVEDLLSLIASFSGKFYKMRSIETKRKTINLAKEHLETHG